MNLEEIQDLYEFNSWANKRILGAVEPLVSEQYHRDLGSSHGGVHGTLVHAMGAEEIWFKRWNGESPSHLYTAAEFPTLAAVAERWAAIDASLIAFSRAALTDTKAVVSYKDMKGNPYAQPLGQLMQHLVNHSTYHRGQVVTMLRQLGTAAVATDLVAFYRLRPIGSRA